MRELTTPLLFAIALGACQPLPAQPGGQPSSGSAEITIEPAAAFDAIPPVLRLRLAWSDSDGDAPEDVLLIAGELTAYHLGRIQKRDLPQTLVERIVPVLWWRDGETLVIAPSVPLAAGSPYTLASPARGRIADFRVATEARPLLRRVWPPADAGTGSEHVIFCGDEPLVFDDRELLLDPGRVAASVEPATDACLVVSPSAAIAAGTRLIPPPLAGRYAFDPSPIEHAPHAPPPDATCAMRELRFGPGCIDVQDDRAIVRSGAEPMLWIVRAEELTLLEAVPADRRFLLRGLAPSSAIPVRLTVLDTSGRETTANVTIHTGSPLPRLVINEVLANPLGAEPEQEWVEIVNDGVVAVELAGFALEDVGGQSVLPAAALAPGEYLLIARDDFVTDDGLDVAPAADVPIVRVAQLGKGGLSNTGEPLVLRAPDGHVSSRFTALPQPKPGISIARRRSWDLDDDPEAFFHHAAPGASPGRPNELAPPSD